MENETTVFETAVVGNNGAYLDSKFWFDFAASSFCYYCIVLEGLQMQLDLSRSIPPLPILFPRALGHKITNHPDPDPVRSLGSGDLVILQFWSGVVSGFFLTLWCQSSSSLAHKICNYASSKITDVLPQ